MLDRVAALPYHGANPTIACYCYGQGSQIEPVASRQNTRHSEDVHTWTDVQGSHTTCMASADTSVLKEIWGWCRPEHHWKNAMHCPNGICAW